MSEHDEGPPEFAARPDLASRLLGGSVVAASDELFAEKENLIKPGPPGFDPAEFGNRGKVYDGWETRRRRGPGHDHAIVRLGVPGVVHGVVVDTSFFRGNYPPQVSVEALGADGYPSSDPTAGWPGSGCTGPPGPTRASWPAPWTWRPWRTAAGSSAARTRSTPRPAT